MSRTEPTTATRIATITVSLLQFPLVHRGPRKGPAGARPRFAQHALVRVTDDSGMSGWGEVPGVSDEEWLALVQEFAPALLRHPWQRPTEAVSAWTDLTWRPRVAAGLDAACWDLWSRHRETPLAHTLGGDRTAITAGVTLGRQPSVDTLVTEINRQVGAGFRRIRLEIEPGWDLDVVRAVQQSYPFLVLQVNAAGSYTEEPEDLERLRALDEYGLVTIEQPFADDDLAAHARLRRELRTPIALNTSVTSLAALDEAMRMEAGDALNLRVAQLGGLTPARRAHDRAADAGWQVWCGSDGESGVGRAAIVALSALPGITLPSEMPGAGGWFSRDVVTPPVRAHDGITPIPLTQPGLGHEIDENTVRALTVESVFLGPEDRRQGARI